MNSGKTRKLYSYPEYQHTLKVSDSGLPKTILANMEFNSRFARMLKDIVRIQKTLLLQAATKMPVLLVTGPRQSGKTTLCKASFPNHQYVNLEDPMTLLEAKEDPRRFLTSGAAGIVVDEVQKFPELLSYIQVLSDELGRNGYFILTGSQNLLLSASVSQSLAGRVFIAHLLPLSLAELANGPHWHTNVNRWIVSGLYPRLHDQQMKPEMFYPSYIQTYVERDVRQIVNVQNTLLFQRFMKLAAGRVGQLLNYSNMAVELGVDLNTVKAWFSILEQCFVCHLSLPHHANFNKRVVKTPKLYFFDTGLACSLLGIRNEEMLDAHWARGALFENLVVNEIRKGLWNRGLMQPLYFWRDSSGNEVDFIVENGAMNLVGEIKSSQFLPAESFKSLDRYASLSKRPNDRSLMIYGGQENTQRQHHQVWSWQNIDALVETLG